MTGPVDRARDSDWYARREAEARFIERKPELQHPLLRNLHPALAQAFVGLVVPTDQPKGDSK